jgi:hypothetical protein
MLETSTLEFGNEVGLRYIKSTESGIYICYSIPDSFGEADANEANRDIFMEYFKNLTKKLIGPEIEIHHSGLLKDEKIWAINNSNVFIILLSNKISPDFKNELKLIEKKYFENSQYLQLLKVRLTPGTKEYYVPFLKNVPAFNFYDNIVNNENHTTEKAGKDSIISQLKQSELANITFEVENYFKNHNKITNSLNDKPTVFLAYTTPDQSANRDIIKREIEQFGFRVLPTQQLPGDANAFKTAIEADISICDFSIHIIGEDYGDIPSGEIHSFVDIQNKIAANIFSTRKNSSDYFKRIIWIPPDLKVSTELQNLYIKKLKNDNSGFHEYEILEIPLENFKTNIINKLKSIALNEVSESQDQTKKNKIYIIHEKIDSENVQPLVAYLKLNNCEPILSGYSEKGANNNINHIKNLVGCEYVILYSLSNNQSWLKTKISDLFKAPGYGKKGPFLAKVILTNMNAIDFENASFRGFQILHHNKDISITMSPFLEQLKANDERS